MRERTLKFKSEIEVKVTATPNFVLTVDGNRSIPVQDLTDDQLELLAQAWKLDLMEKVKRRRKGQPD